MLHKRIIYRIHELGDIIELFENWYARILEFFELYPSKLIQYRTRKGQVYYVRQKTSDTCSIIHTLGSRGYFKRFGIKEGDTVIDIGANIGAFSIQAGTTATKGIVYAFEPVEKNFVLLKKNIEANNLKNVKAFQAAVLDKDGKAKIFLAKTNGSHSIYPGNKKSKDFAKVDSTTLKKILSENRIKKCDFLKIDCEGAEYKILFGSSPNTLKKVKKIAMEFHCLDPENSPAKLRHYLEKNGFQTIVAGEIAEKNIGMLYATRTDLGEQAGEKK